LRTGFAGEIWIFKNSENPIFLTPREGVREIYVDIPNMTADHAGAERAWCLKYQMAQHLPAQKFEKIVFLDADCLALRNIEHLLEGDWDIAVQAERGSVVTQWNYNSYLTETEMTHPPKGPGINSGTWAVKGSIFHEVMAAWQTIDEAPPLRECKCRDQSSWNRLLLDNAKSNRWNVHHWPEGEIAFPLYLDPHYKFYAKAALTHHLGGDTREKLRFAFGLWMETFVFDDSCLFFHFMEV
jgi:lipopolysaccharide biosynthesis glycosyltransferase